MLAALAWYRSDEYTEIRKIREGAARARITPSVASPECARARIPGSSPPGHVSAVERGPSLGDAAASEAWDAS